MKVSYPIEVPSGEYCTRWDLLFPCICDHFDNEGGHSDCEFFHDVTDVDEGVLKSKRCFDLKEIK